ncbi:MAG: RNA-binding protein [Thiohalocapsa sp.]
MTQKILIGNLPPEVTVEDITKVLTDAGVEQPKVTLNNEGDASKVTAVLALEDVDRATVDRIAGKINGTRYQGRTINAYVPLFT